ncbi:YcaO-like family protein [Nonomuraea sp. NPDC050536]|uniref:YcaO-like family protein n=1 Tax=Nonomuraea sp. NPDC050536 TaxID=3364366 RepID=UPI0037C8281D
MDDPYFSAEAVIAPWHDEPYEPMESLVSRRIGPVQELREWVDADINLRRVVALGTAVDRVHGEITPVVGVGRSTCGSMARTRAMGEFIERLTLMEPPKALVDPRRGARDGHCPLDEAWVEAVDLATGVTTPRAASDYYVHPASCPTSQRSDRPSTNGTAAGHTLASATERALLELLERDALMTMWRYRLRSPVVEPDLRTRCEAKESGLQCRFLDLSWIHGVPTVVCVTDGWYGGQRVRAVGSACDRSFPDAGLRALRESIAAHSMCVDWLADDYGGPLDFSSFAHNAFYHLDGAHMEFADSCEPAAEHAPGAWQLAGHPQEVVDGLVSRLARRQIAVYAVDISSPTLRKLGWHTAALRSPDLYPLEVGFGDRSLAERMRAHPCRVELKVADQINLVPVPLA